MKKYQKLQNRLKELKKENVSLKGALSDLRERIANINNLSRKDWKFENSKIYWKRRYTDLEKRNNGLYEVNNQQYKEIKKLRVQLKEKDIEISALNNVLCKKTGDYIETKKELLILQKEKELESNI